VRQSLQSIVPDPTELVALDSPELGHALMTSLLSLNDFGGLADSCR
jgi:hypothetical protein